MPPAQPRDRTAAGDAGAGSSGCTSLSRTRRTCSGPGLHRSRICAWTRSSKPRFERESTRFIPVTAFLPRTPTSPAGSRRPDSRGSGRRRRRSRRWARRSRPCAEPCAAAGVPVVPGTTRPATSVEDVLEAAADGRPDRGQGRGGGGGRGCASRTQQTRSRGHSRLRVARARRTSPTPPSTSSATSTTHCTSRFRSWRDCMAT